MPKNFSKNKFALRLYLSNIEIIKVNKNIILGLSEIESETGGLSLSIGINSVFF